MNLQPNLRPTDVYQAMDAAHHWHPFTDTADLAAKGARVGRVRPGCVAARIVARLARRVYAIERHRPLARAARALLPVVLATPLLAALAAGLVGSSRRSPGSSFRLSA